MTQSDDREHEDEADSAAFQDLPPIPVAQTTRSYLTSRLWTIAAPAMAIHASEGIAQATDAAMLSRLGTNALATLTPGGLLLLIPLTAAIGLLMAVTTHVSQSVGLRRPELAGRFCWAGIVFAVAVGLASLCLHPLAPWLIGLFRLDPEVAKPAVTYFQIGLQGFAPFLAGVAISNFFIGCGRPRKALSGSLVFLLANVVFNYGLIFGHWGLPRLGIAGAAWGGVAASWTYCAFMLIRFLRPSWNRFGNWDAGIYPPVLRTILRTGLPIGLAEGFEIFAWNAVITWLIGRFGSPDLAAAAIILRLMQLSYLPALGVGAAVNALVGQAVGAGNEKTAKTITAIALRWVTVGMISYGLIVIVAQHFFLHHLTTDPEVVKAFRMALIAFFVVQIADGPGIILGDALRGADDTRWISVVQLLSTIVVLIGGGTLVAFRFDHLGSAGIWAVDAVFVVTIAISTAYRWFSKKTWNRAIRA